MFCDVLPRCGSPGHTGWCRGIFFGTRDQSRALLKTTDHPLPNTAYPISSSLSSLIHSCRAHCAAQYRCSDGQKKMKKTITCEQTTRQTDGSQVSIRRGARSQSDGADCLKAQNRTQNMDGFTPSTRTFATMLRTCAIALLRFAWTNCCPRAKFLLRLSFLLTIRHSRDQT